jgi:hypothetical protein
MTGYRPVALDANSNNSIDDETKQRCGKHYIIWRVTMTLAVDLQ